MKTRMLALSVLTLPLVGCVTKTVYVERPAPAPVAVEAPAAPAPEVVVQEAPPPPKTEVIVAAPGPNYVWTSGYWSWQGHWVWIGGRYVIRPHPHAVWVAGHWAHRGHGHVWIEGRWRS
jgi:hypothetical protein